MKIKNDKLILHESLDPFNNDNKTLTVEDENKITEAAITERNLINIGEKLAGNDNVNKSNLKPLKPSKPLKFKKRAR